MILTLGRSGSNTLVNLLNQHPEVMNVGEVLGPWTPFQRLRRRLGLWRAREDAYLDALTRLSPVIRGALTLRGALRLARGKGSEIRWTRHIRTLGIKDFHFLMARHGLSDWLETRPDIKVIGLVRDDPVSLLVSYLVMTGGGAVASTEAGVGNRRMVHVPPEEIADMLGQARALICDLRQALAALPPQRVLLLEYDSLYRDDAALRAGMDRVFAFLGVSPRPVETQRQKIITVPPASLIANRAACAAALVGTEFEGVLDLPPDWADKA